MRTLNAAPSLTAPSAWHAPIAILHRLGRLYPQFGVRDVIRWLADRVAKRLIYFQVDNLVCFNVDRLPEPPPIEPGLSFRFLTVEELRACSAEPANDIDHWLVERAAAGHELCFGVFVNERLAGYGWCTFGSIDPRHTEGVAMSCPPHVAYTYKGFTHPEFRGKRLNGLRVLLAAKQLATRGIEKIVALVDWTNGPSMRSCLDTGGAVLGRLVTIGLGRYRWTFSPKAARAIGIEFGTHVAQSSAGRKVHSADSFETGLRAI
jgi:hypothetical protein